MGKMEQCKTCGAETDTCGTCGNCDSHCECGKSELDIERGFEADSGEDVDYE